MELKIPGSGNIAGAVRGLSRLAAAEKATRTRWALAIAIAAVSDFLSIWLAFTVWPQLGLDAATALLILAVLGWRWPLLIALIPEAVPGIAVFPFWVLVVTALAAVQVKKQTNDKKTIDVDSMGGV